MATGAVLVSGLHRRSQAILEVQAMDAARFDTLARSLQLLRSRRGALAGAHLPPCWAESSFPSSG
jgi:hypothetical protein